MANYLISGMKQQGITLLMSQATEKVTLTLTRTRSGSYGIIIVPYINGYFGAFGKFRSDDAKTGDLIALVCSTTGATYFPSEVTINDTESYPIERRCALNPCFEEGGALQHSAKGAGMVVTRSRMKRQNTRRQNFKWFTDTQRNIDFSVALRLSPR